ncbi:structural toxin protein [Moniliophthora roreri MCA 2997]|uniref:ATP phosphoribosyltransferase n=1 Tax=Moniliophthora roreri (strain MCA 2997) TaxID=1381753 RepID=V2XYJ1_MONRO|nr:structural toxin protein [Moniliophthora roreri MCA 2997]
MSLSSIMTKRTSKDDELPFWVTCTFALMSVQRFKMVFFTPSVNTRSILDHLFAKYPQELGKIGNYEQCAFITRGTGQFKPTSDADPTIGTVAGSLEFVEEDRVELVINDKGKKDEVRKAIEELRKVHPYEEVAVDIYKVEDI